MRSLSVFFAGVSAFAYAEGEAAFVNIGSECMEPLIKVMNNRECIGVYKAMNAAGERESEAFDLTQEVMEQICGKKSFCLQHMMKATEMVNDCMDNEYEKAGFKIDPAQLEDPFAVFKEKDFCAKDVVSGLYCSSVATTMANALATVESSAPKETVQASVCPMAQAMGCCWGTLVQSESVPDVAALCGLEAYSCPAPKSKIHILSGAFQVDGVTWSQFEKLGEDQQSRISFALSADLKEALLADFTSIAVLDLKLGTEGQLAVHFAFSSMTEVEVDALQRKIADMLSGCKWATFTKLFSEFDDAPMQAETPKSSVTVTKTVVTAPEVPTFEFELVPSKKSNALSASTSAVALAAVLCVL